MKKVLLVICILLIPFQVFSVALEDLPESPSIKIQVIGTRADLGSFDIGFCKNEILKWEDIPKPFTSDELPLIVTVDNDKNTIAKSADKQLYLYWRLFTEHTVELSCAVSGPLKHSSAGEENLVGEDPKRLDWKVKWPKSSSTLEVGLDSKLNKADEFILVKTISPSNASIGSCLALEVETYPVMGKMIDGSYAGLLKLKIAVK